MVEAVAIFGTVSPSVRRSRGRLGFLILVCIVFVPCLVGVLCVNLGRLAEGLGDVGGEVLSFGNDMVV